MISKSAIVAILATYGAPVKKDPTRGTMMDWQKLWFQLMLAFIAATTTYALLDAKERGATETTLAALTTAVAELRSSVADFSIVAAKLDGIPRAVAKLQLEMGLLKQRAHVAEETAQDGSQ